MPQHFIPHCDDVCAYTFPLVRSLLDGEVGIPGALETIPAPYRDSLVATLATELANISAVFLQLGKKTTYNYRIEEVLLARHGGIPFHSALKKLSELGAEQQTATDEIRRFERLGYSVSDRWPEEIPGAVLQRGEHGTTTRWRYDIIPGERVDYIRAHLESANSRSKELRQESDSLHQAFLDLGKEIKKSDGYRTDYDRLRWKQMKADFSTYPGYQASGAALFLRNINYSWWVSFTAAFAAKVERDGVSGPDRMALRDPEVLREIRSLSADAPKWYGSASEYVSQHSLEWGTIIRTPKALKGVREDLLGEDQESMEWLRIRGRKANLYTLWLRNLYGDLERTEREGYWAPAKIDRSWLRSNVERYCTGPVFENEDWRFNELSWCLSREHPDLYKFVPLVSQHQSLKAWEAHRAKWWAEIEATKLGISQSP